MKRLLILTTLILGCATTLLAQWGVGLRDNKFVYGDFTFCRNYVVSFEQSVFAEKPAFQYSRLYAGYKGSVKEFDYSGRLYFGSAWNTSYYSGGAMINLRYLLFKRLIINAKLNPNYDSDYGYNTCWQAGVGAVITRNIDILLAYTTIPEYRMSEKRVHAGFDFHVGKLSVTPTLSIGTGGESKSANLRVLGSFRYEF